MQNRFYLRLDFPRVLPYNIRMQNEDSDTRKLTCQVNVRMTPEMREQLEDRAREQWTSASQVARMAVARELDLKQEVVPDKFMEELRLASDDKN